MEKRIVIDMKGIKKRFYIGTPNELEVLKESILKYTKGNLLPLSVLPVLENQL